MKILVTGGAGYIGAHTVLVLLEAGYEVVVVDNLANASTTSLERVAQITEKAVTLIECDIRDSVKLNDVFSEHQISQVIHFAGLKAVGESCEQPLTVSTHCAYGALRVIRY